MTIVLSDRATVRKLLCSELQHTELPLGNIRCCPIGDVFFQVELIKKRGGSTAKISDSTSEFHRAMGSSAVQIAPLDAQALGSGLFVEDEHPVAFYSDAIDSSRHPSQSIDVVALRDFDSVWSTTFLKELLSREQSDA